MKLFDGISLNVGLVLSDDDEMNKLHTVLAKNKLVSGARAGAIIPVDGEWCSYFESVDIMLIYAYL